MKTLAAVAFLAVASAATAGSADETALAALDRAYVDAWKQSDPTEQERAVLSLFTEDAVILPGGGMAPKQGLSELRGFWFPEGMPPTRVLLFEHEIAGIESEGSLGVVHGRSRLRFEYDGRETAQEGNFLLVARRAEDGSWGIARLIWNNRVVD